MHRSQVRGLQRWLALLGMIPSCMGLGLSRALSRRARNRAGGRGEAGVFSGEGRGHGGGLSTEFGV